MPRHHSPPQPHLQLVDDTPFPLDIPEEEKPAVFEQRRHTTVAWRQLGAPVHYCTPREDKPFDSEDDGEGLHVTDPELRIWQDVKEKQGLNAAVALQQGLIEVSFFGPDQSLNAAFFPACAKVGIPPRYVIGRRSRQWGSSVLFKLREDEAKRLDDDYSGFRPKSFTIDDARRGILLNIAPPQPRKNARINNRALALLPGSLLWHSSGAKQYDLFVWFNEAGNGPGLPRETSAPLVDFFSILRAAAYAAILCVVSRETWQTQIAPRAFAQWLARAVREGQAINSNISFSKASRSVLSEPKHAEDLLALICEQRSDPTKAAATLAACLETFQTACRKLDADGTRRDVAGWAAVAASFGEEIQRALRTALTVGADSSLLEDYAERYLFHLLENQFIDREFFAKSADSKFVFKADHLKLRHAPDLIQTPKKPVSAFPLFIESKLRQDVTDIEMYPDEAPGSIIRLTRQGDVIDDDAYAPENSRLIFNEWRGLDIRPAKTVNEALEIECEEKLDYMLSLVTNRQEARADWIKAHFGWTLKNPGKKQQVALVCTGDQGTGKSFLCTTFAKAVFGNYADTASVRALSGQFYIAGYTGKLWVSHDEYVSDLNNAEILKTLIRGTRVSGEIKGRDTATYTIFARLAFTSNEANPGIGRGKDDRGLFQVTSISAESEGLLPGEFQDRMRKEVKPFYEGYDAFLKRLDVRQTYVRMLMERAPSNMSEVEDLTYSAMRDENVARAHLTPAQLVAKVIIEDGTVFDRRDISMPFRDVDLTNRVQQVAKSMGIRGLRDRDVLDEFLKSGLLSRLPGGPYLFKWKIGGLQRLYGDYLGVPLFSRWPLDPLDDRPNEWREGEPIESWKGKR